MLMSHRGSGSARPFKAKYLLGAVIAASMGASAAHAASFGHSRIVSALGRPLHIEIPVTQLTQQELESLRAVPAPASAWREAGMKPPVALESMRLVLLDGYSPDIKVIQLRSDESFDRPIADVLLDISSVSGRQRYQVSLLAHADHNAVLRAPAENARNPRVIDGRETVASAGDHATAGARIPVQSGDNMFAIAERNAVQGVTVYQMMIALQRANRTAFIEDNVNLVKAGATLTMPGMDELTALSDREARRIFLQHMQAFERYRQRGVGAGVAAVTDGVLVEEAPAEGEVTEQVSTSPTNVHTASAGGDFLRLSGGESGGGNGHSPEGAAPRAASGTSAAASQAGVSNSASATAAAVAGRPAQGNGKEQQGDRPLSLLASSGLIASDAAPAKGAAPSSAAANGTSPDPAAAAKADDEAAVRKGMAESRTRVLELEDNVRHLNEALQKQGHVAAEAALEGARSVSEVIKEAIGLKETGQAGANATSEEAGRVGSNATPQGAGQGGATAGTTGQQSVPSSSVAPSAGMSGAQSGSVGSGGGGAPSQADAGSGARPGTGGTPGAGGTFDAREGVSRAAPARPDSAGGANSTRSDQSMPGVTENKVAWWQENLLAIIGGGLALIVLVAVWVLRRFASGKGDIFESDSPITDAMVREKLSDIDLDLPSPEASGRRAH